jgi:hypothetical protein
VDEEGLLDMEVPNKHKQGRVQTKPNLLGGLQIQQQQQTIGALEQNVNLGMILICKWRP